MPFTEKLLGQILNGLVEKLDFKDCPLTAHELLQLFSSLHYNKTVKSLNLSNSQLCTPNSTINVTVLSSFINGLINSNIQSLTISEGGITNVEVTHYITNLLPYASLTRLDLSKNFIGNQGAEALFHNLGFTSSLRSLSLTGNLINDKGTINLPFYLNHNKSLTYLDLSDNLLEGWGLSSIITTISPLRGVTITVNLYQNKIPEDYYSTKLSPLLIGNKFVRLLFDLQEVESYQKHQAETLKKGPVGKYAPSAALPYKASPLLEKPSYSSVIKYAPSAALPYKAPSLLEKPSYGPVEPPKLSGKAAGSYKEKPGKFGMSSGFELPCEGLSLYSSGNIYSPYPEDRDRGDKDISSYLYEIGSALSQPESLDFYEREHKLQEVGAGSSEEEEF